MRNFSKIIPGVRKNVCLAPYTTFGIGGSAKYFFEAKNKKNLIEAIKMAKKFSLPFFILGGGSNVLVSDKGFNGIVIKVKSQKSKVKITSQKSKIIETETGTPLSKIIALAFKNNLTGLEWAVGIPGTVGGAIYGNAGAFGMSMADIVKSVEILEFANNKIQNSKFKMQNENLKFKIKEYKNKDCQFGYRDSIFKKKKNLIILSAALLLKKRNKKEIQEKIKEYLNYRKKTQPLNFPSAGSIFKNPEGFSAGELIGKCGLKGKRIGNAQISEKHSNFIVNLGKAKARDVKRLINLAKKKVKKQFGIVLEEEIELL